MLPKLDRTVNSPPTVESGRSRSGFAVVKQPFPVRRSLSLVLAGGLLASACSDRATDTSPAGSGDPGEGAPPGGDSAQSGGSTADSAVDLPPLLDLAVPDPSSVYDPVRGGEQPPGGYRQLLRRDAIEPVYDPVFTLADQVDWPEDSLVIGVHLNDEARAYPVGFLTLREIVNDDHRGIPTLVTW